MILTSALSQAVAAILIFFLSIGGLLALLNGASYIKEGWRGHVYFWPGGLMMGAGLSALFTVESGANVATIAVIAVVISAVSYVGAYWLMRDERL